MWLEWVRGACARQAASWLRPPALCPGLQGCEDRLPDFLSFLSFLQGCPINLDGSLPTPFYSDTPIWWAQFNATLHTYPSPADASASAGVPTAAQLAEAEAKATVVLAQELGQSLQGTHSNQSFVWPQGLLVSGCWPLGGVG